MSSGFVSGGTIDNPTERDDEWRRAQAELEEKRRQREAEGRQNDGKSLFEVLQANKAAKQEAFEEAARLKNQYRALDDDEAEFLDSVLEGTRKKEAEVQKETMEQLNAFRRRQEEAERKAFEEEQRAEGGKEDVGETHAQWVAGGRKRKKGHELLKGVKLRKGSSADKVEETTKSAKEAKTLEEGKTPSIALEAAPVARAAPAKPMSASPPPNPSGSVSLGLGYASSDEDG